MKTFVPLFRSSHLQTIAGHFWPRRVDALHHPVEARLVRTEPQVQVLVETQRPAGVARGDIVLVHGLEASARSGYMLSVAGAGLEAGFAVHRFQMRTCGGTEHLCRTLYHAGLTADLLAVVRQLGRPVFLAGFSLGGNVVLKLAGELGEGAAGLLAGVCAVSTPIDLGASARRIDRPENRIYQTRFVRRMRRRLCAAGRYRAADFEGLRSIPDIDEHITAPAFGFAGAEEYYRTQSCGQFLERIRVPALVIQAKDDSLVPFESVDHPAFRSNPCLRLLATEHGGHLGFVARGKPRLWMDAAVIEWILQVSGTKDNETPSSV